MNQQLSALLEGLAWEEFREAKLVERFRGKVAVVIPAYNEAASVGDVIRRIPKEVCGEPCLGPRRRRWLAATTPARRPLRRVRSSRVTSSIAAAARRCGPGIA